MHREPIPQVYNVYHWVEEFRSIFREKSHRGKILLGVILFFFLLRIRIVNSHLLEPTTRTLSTPRPFPLSYRANHHLPISCPKQFCRRYSGYVPLIPPEFRICSECHIEMELYSKYGAPFSYRTTNDPNYPVIPYGVHQQYLCKPHLDQHAAYDVFFVICSSAAEFERREDLRERLETISRHYNVGYMFVLGSNITVDAGIRRESRKHRDILQLAHTDSYHHITLSVFGAFQFLAGYSEMARYFMKTDSDCVYNIPRIVQTAQQVIRPYIGNCRYLDYYITKKRHLKMAVPEQLIQKDTKIPPYATGAGYLIHSSILPHLVVALRHLNFIAHNEDVNIGKAFHLLNRNCTMEDQWVARSGCTSREDCLEYAVIHKNTSDFELALIWEMVMSSLEKEVQVTKLL